MNSDDLIVAMLARVQRCEDFWSQLGARATLRSPLGKHLKAFYLSVWDKWSANVTTIAGHPLSHDEAGQLLYNVGIQLEQILFIAATRFELPVPDLSDLAPIVAPSVPAPGVA